MLDEDAGDVEFAQLLLNPHVTKLWLEQPTEPIDIIVAYFASAAEITIGGPFHDKIVNGVDLLHPRHNMGAILCRILRRIIVARFRTLVANTKETIGPRRFDQAFIPDPHRYIGFELSTLPFANRRVISAGNVSDILAVVFSYDDRFIDFFWHLNNLRRPTRAALDLLFGHE